MAAFLVTDYLENPENKPIDGFRRGTFSELESLLDALPAAGREA